MKVKACGSRWCSGGGSADDRPTSLLLFALAPVLRLLVHPLTLLLPTLPLVPMPTRPLLVPMPALQLVRLLPQLA
jgi:hypothetical protein